MVGQLGHFRTRQHDRERFSLGDLDDDVMRHMEACLVCQHHKSGNDFVATLVSVLSWENMLASLDPRALEIYSRADIIGLLREHGTSQAVVWISKEDDLSDYGQDNMTIIILWPKVYSFVGTEIHGMTSSELCDVGFGALLENMRVSGTCTIDSFHCWRNLKASQDEYALWQDGSPWLRIRYSNEASSWLAGGLASARDDSWEMGLCERLLDGWILYLLVSLVGDLHDIHDVGILQDYTSQGTAVRILIWDPGIGVLGSPNFDGVKIRVEWLLGELTKDSMHTIILLIRSIWVSCMVSTWRGHVLRRAYYKSHRWIWDPGIICRLIHLLLEDKQYFSREDCNVPSFGHYYVTECYAYQSSQMGVTVSSGVIEGFYWAQLASFIIFHHQDPFRKSRLWFRCIRTISIILSYYGSYFN
jgi:hypothetical protein